MSFYSRDRRYSKENFDCKKLFDKSLDFSLLSKKSIMRKKSKNSFSLKMSLKKRIIELNEENEKRLLFTSKLKTLIKTEKYLKSEKEKKDFIFEKKQQKNQQEILKLKNELSKIFKNTKDRENILINTKNENKENQQKINKLEKEIITNVNEKKYNNFDFKKEKSLISQIEKKNLLDKQKTHNMKERCDLIKEDILEVKKQYKLEEKDKLFINDKIEKLKNEIEQTYNKNNFLKENLKKNEIIFNNKNNNRNEMDLKFEFFSDKLDDKFEEEKILNFELNKISSAIETKEDDINKKMFEKVNLENEKSKIEEELKLLEEKNLDLKNNKKIEEFYITEKMKKKKNLFEIQKKSENFIRNLIEVYQQNNQVPIIIDIIKENEEELNEKIKKIYHNIEDSKSFLEFL